jgi:hypothetical protein
LRAAALLALLLSARHCDRVVVASGDAQCASAEYAWLLRGRTRTASCGRAGGYPKLLLDLVAGTLTGIARDEDPRKLV